MKIKLIDNKTDLSKCEIKELDWDINVRGIDYKCFRIKGYIHSIGGKWGENDYWCCPRTEDPTPNNLIEFNGYTTRYEIQVKENNYIKTKWDESEVENSVSCHILRNDKEFYSFVCRDTAYAWAKAYSLIESTIKEGVIDFWRFNYIEEEIIGRHIWYKGQPYTLCTYMEGQCCSMAIAGHQEKDFDYYDSNEDGIKIDLLMDKNIQWFCPEY